MRVIIWGINYSPEPTGIAPYTAELAEYLTQRDWQVEVVTGFPYYPAWRKQPQDRGRLGRTDEIAGVTVHRCWQYVPRRLSTVQRVLHELSFGLTSVWRLLRLRPADLYVVISPPLCLGPLAWAVTRLKRSRYLFHVQDLQPDSAAGLGMVRPGVFLRLLFACERFTYRHAAGVSVISPGMAEAVTGKGVPPAKVFHLPNWLRPAAPGPARPDDGSFRRRHGIPAEALLAVYSGNLGRKQGLEVLLNAANFLVDAGSVPGRPVYIVIAGDGAMRDVLARRLERLPLDNVRLLPLLADEEYQAMLRTTDVAVVAQMPGTGNVCFPSKLLSVLAAGLPVVAVTDRSSGLARAVEEGGFGRVVLPGDSRALAAVLAEAAGQPALCRQWAAHSTWVRQFSPDLLLPRFEEAMHELVVSARREQNLSGAVEGPVPSP